MPLTSVQDDNLALVAKAMSYIRNIRGGISGTEPRFTIYYTGFGSGGTAGVTADGAVRFLRTLAGPNDMHARYGRRITNIEVTVSIDPVQFAA